MYEINNATMDGDRYKIIRVPGHTPMTLLRFNMHNKQNKTMMSCHFKIQLEQQGNALLAHDN